MPEGFEIAFAKTTSILGTNICRSRECTFRSCFVLTSSYLAFSFELLHLNFNINAIKDCLERGGQCEPPAISLTKCSEITA